MKSFETRTSKFSKISNSSTLTYFYMGFWRYVNTLGGQKEPPWLNARKLIQTW